MYILFFGSFIIFFDCINFVIATQKTKKNRIQEGAKTRNLIYRYLHACDKRNIFIKTNHFVCIASICLSVLIQIASFFPAITHMPFFEWAILFLLCFFVYLFGYRIAEAVFMQIKEASNGVRKVAFLLCLVLIILTFLAAEFSLVLGYIFLNN